MKIRRIFLFCTIALITGAWAPRGHQNSNRAAVRALPANGPAFLKDYEDWIAETGPLPDYWRGSTEPYAKISEDPNHGWFREQFAFMTAIPRSRYEFVLRLYDEFLKIREKDPGRAALTNVRWTGTLPYAAIESYDRMKATMRLYRRLAAASSPEAQKQAKWVAQDIAFQMGVLGHYVADGAQPLHVSIHHDGWQGPNPKGYSTDPRIHSVNEGSFVDLIQLTEADLLPLMGDPKIVEDPFAAILANIDDATSHVEEIYILDKEGAFTKKDNVKAARLMYGQLARSAALLRDLTYTAWQESQKPMVFGNAGSDPASRSNPGYNPETGSAAPGPAVKQGGK